MGGLCVRAEEVAVLVLAGGRSRRMGTAKMLLAWREDGTRVIRCAVASLMAAARGGVHVTVDEESAGVANALAGIAYHEIRVDGRAEQMDSLRAGLESLTRGAGHISHALVHPGDHPVVHAGTVQAVLDGAREDAAVMPVYHGKGGHPVLIPRSLWEEIAGWRGEGGLAQYWRENPHKRVRLPVEDEGTVLTMNTPEEYTRARRRWAGVDA